MLRVNQLLILFGIVTWTVNQEFKKLDPPPTVGVSSVDVTDDVVVVVTAADDFPAPAPPPPTSPTSSTTTDDSDEPLLLPSPTIQRLKVSLTKAEQQEGKPLEFVHIPKTGGTAMEAAAAAQQNIKWGICNYKAVKEWPGCDRDPPYLEQQCGDHMSQCWHQPPHRLLGLEQNIYADKSLFAVVRNPYTRIISEYYCPWTNGYHGPNKAKARTLNWYIQDRIHSYLNGTLEEDPELHMLPQSHYIFNDMEHQQVDHVVFYENLNQQLHTLMTNYNLHIKLDTQINQGSNVKHNNKRLTVADLQPDTIALLNEFYQRDFDYLGYRKIDPNKITKQHSKQSLLESYDTRSIYMI